MSYNVFPTSALTSRRVGARRRPARAAGGFTLLEVMLASFVLVLAITGAITTLQRGFQALDTARNYTYASQVMQSEIERLRLVNWTELQALQDAGDASIPMTSVAGTTSAQLSCTRQIRDLKTDMKEITLTTTWLGHDGRSHDAKFITRYGRSGLYDYAYTAH